ncbi:hypothetical protein IOQ59_13215 [Pontibacterium sp. N1Y112]|uniref:Uncharacterized protein n=1 Tax=Pontibacterium sinense TaxID=2781979 RepID=A0A8J7FAX6_9GAMM|nr:hypothetical protein [Pontibacterium sinense]MBE9398215.1 hypothetical protein [Pontibacterium sinense]
MNATTCPTPSPLNDEAFISAFEDLSLSPELFDHKGHMRICWLYLNRYSLDIALQRTCDGIQSYATSLGATDKFDYPLTAAFVRIMSQRVDADTTANWATFLDQNKDLVDDAKGVIRQYDATLVK